MTGGWLRPITVLALATLLGWSALSHAVVTITHARKPAIALKLDPDDPVALVRQAQASLATDSSAKNTAAAVVAARRSIREQALNPRAFQLLGFAVQNREAADKISARVRFSDRLSRRDLATQMWLIEEAVRRNDVGRALQRYDVALRAAPASEALLFPVLTRAMDEPAIRRHFIAYIAARPPWLQGFLRTAVTTSLTPRSVAALVIEAGGFPPGPEFQTFNGQLIRRLAERGDYVGALDFYARVPNTSETVLATTAMTAVSTDRNYGPITWQAYELDGIDASFVATRDGMELNAQLDNTYDGRIAEKLLGLRPGRYRLEARQKAQNPGAFSQLSWRAVCVGQGQGRQLFSRSVDLNGASTMSLDFTVDRTCPIQLVLVAGRAGIESGSLDLSIGPVSLTALPAS